MARAETVPGASFVRAAESKAATYPELVASDSVAFTTLACEIGGRWSTRCVEVIQQLAAARARSAPRHLQLSARLAFEARWWALLSCTQQDTLAATLVDDSLFLLDGHDAANPFDVDVIIDEACEGGT